MTTDTPIVEVRTDYDGYFEALVREWIDDKAESGAEFNHGVVTVNAGPYHSYAVSYEKDGTTIHLDFYSALRTGFGNLSAEDIAAIKELL
jgi:hypothetical protein